MTGGIVFWTLPLHIFRSFLGGGESMITNHKPGLEVIMILLWHSAKHSKAVKLALMADDERLAIEMLTSKLKLSF